MTRDPSPDSYDAWATREPYDRYAPRPERRNRKIFGTRKPKQQPNQSSK